MTAFPAFRHRAAASLVTLGPGLVDDADNPQGHRDLLQLQAVGEPLAGEGLPHRVGGLGHLLHGGGHILNAGLCQRQAVQQSPGHARLPPRLDVQGVGGQQLLPPLPQGAGGVEQSGLLQSARVGKGPGSGFGPGAHFIHGHGTASFVRVW